MGQRAVDLGPQRLQVDQIHDADGAAARPCPHRPGRCRAWWCRSHSTPAPASRRPSKLAVQRQDQRGIVGDAQILARDADAGGAQRADFLRQRPGVDDDAIADHRQLALPHDARGQQRKLVGDAVDDERMPGIVPALEAHDDIGPLRKPVDDLALALIAPLRADDRDIRHELSSFRGTAIGGG